MNENFRILIVEDEEDLNEILKSCPITEIIFCEGKLSFKKIIDTIPLIPHHVSIKFFAKGSHAVIGN